MVSGLLFSASCEHLLLDQFSGAQTNRPGGLFVVAWMVKSFGVNLAGAGRTTGRGAFLMEQSRKSTQAESRSNRYCYESFSSLKHELADSESNPACREEGKDLGLTSSLWGSAILFNGKRRYNFLFPFVFTSRCSCRAQEVRGAEKWCAYQLAPPCYMWKTGGERARQEMKRRLVCVYVCVWWLADKMQTDTPLTEQVITSSVTQRAQRALLELQAIWLPKLTPASAALQSVSFATFIWLP